MHKQLQAVEAQKELLSRAQHEAKLEGLRRYMIQYNIFSDKKRAKQNPTIGMAELKKLAKEWNLNKHSNFWKEYPTKEALAEVLTKYVEQMQMRGDRRRRERSSTSFVVERDAMNKADKKSARETGRQPNLSQVSQLKGDGNQSPSPRHHLDHLRSIKWNLKKRQPHPVREGPAMTMAASLYLSRFKGVGGAGGAGGGGGGGGAAGEGAGGGDDALEELAAAAAAARRGHAVTAEEAALKKDLAASLANLSRLEGSEDALVRHTGALFELALYDDLEVRHLASTALVNLTVTDRARGALVRAGVLAALFHLSAQRVASIRTNVAVALGRLTLDPGAHELLLLEGVHAVFKNLLLGEEQRALYDVEVACLSGLVNLAGGPRGNFSDAVFAVLPSLARKRGDLATCELVARVLRNLSILPASRHDLVDSGCLALFHDALRHAYSPEIIECVATAVANLATLSQCQGDLVFKDALVFLGRVLEEECSDPHVRRLVAQALAQLACAADALCPALLQKGALPLVLGLRGGGPEINTLVAIALSNLAWPAECRPTLITDEVLGALGALMGDGEPGEAQQEAVSALCNLAVHPGMRGHPRFGEVIDSLVGLSRRDGLSRRSSAASGASGANQGGGGGEGGGGGVARFCALALYNLSCSTELHAMLLAKGGAGALLGLATREGVDEENRVRVLDALYHLSCSGGAAAALLEADGADVLVEVVTARLEGHAAFLRECHKKVAGEKHHGVTAAQQAELGRLEGVLRTLALTLFNVTTYRPGRPGLVRDGAVPALVALGALPGPAGKYEVAAALANLSEVLESLDMGLLEALLRLANTNNDAILLQVASCLATLSEGRAREVIADRAAAVAPALNSLLRTGDERTQVAAAVAIVNMATMGVNWNWPIQAVKDFIVISLLRVNSDRTKLLCTHLLHNVLVEEEQRENMVVNGVLYAVVRMANTQEGEAVREVCARAVYNLSTEPRFHGLLAENGGSQMLIRVSKASQTVALQRTVVQALQNLAHAPQWHEKMLEDAPEGEGLLAGLKHLGRFMDVEVRVRVGQILLNLSAHEETRQTLITPDNAILPLLMLLVRTDSEELQFLGCAALCNVSTVVPLHKEMVVGGVLQAMVKVIRRAPLASTAAPAVKCIYNLIAQTLPVSEAVVEAEGVYVLVALAQESRAEETVRTAVKCLAVICSADGMEDRAVEGGAALGLAVGVAYVTTRVLLDRLMYALCRLTADQGRHRQVVQHGALDVVVNLSMPQDLALGDNFVHNCTAALRNLSTSPGFVHEQLFACPGAVPAALKFADAEDPRARANVAVFLHNLAKDDEKAQRAIVKRGGIGRLIELAEREGGAGDVRVVCAITLQALSKYSALDAGGFDPQRFLGGVVTMLQADGAQVARVVNEVTRDCVPGDAPLERGQASYFEGLVGLGDAVWFPHREPEWPYFTEENKGNESLGQDRIRPQDGKMEPIKPRALQTDDGDLIVGAFRPIELPTQKRDVGPLVVEGGQPSLPPSQDHSRRSSGATSVSFRGARALLGDGGGRPAAAGEDGVFPEDSLEGQLSAMTVEMPEVPPPDSQAAMMEEGSKPLLLSKTAPHRL